MSRVRPGVVRTGDRTKVLVQGLKSTAKPNRWSVRELACRGEGRLNSSQPLVPCTIPGNIVNVHT
jgi:hypothetical protein